MKSLGKKALTCRAASSGRDKVKTCEETRNPTYIYQQTGRIKPPKKRGGEEKGKIKKLKPKVKSFLNEKP